MTERILLVISAAILGAVVLLLLRRSQLIKAQNATTVLDGVPIKPDTLHIVYFWSEHCSQCKSAQKPTLDRLIEKVGHSNVELIALRIEDNDELAKSWGVRTLPTTYIINQQGTVTHVNNGLRSESQLSLQLQLEKS